MVSLKVGLTLAKNLITLIFVTRVSILNRRKKKHITNITGKYNMIKEDTSKGRKQIDYIARHDRRLKHPRILKLPGNENSEKI